MVGLLSRCKTQKGLLFLTLLHGLGPGSSPDKKSSRLEQFIVMGNIPSQIILILIAAFKEVDHG